MNIMKIITPDFIFGKILLLSRSIFEIGIMLIARPSAESLHLARIILQVKPKYTMVQNLNLINLYRMVRSINRRGIPGDIVECGVWNGGSSAMMAVACRDTYVPRRFWLFDSFEGLPPPTENDDTSERHHYFTGWNKGSIAHVEGIFRKLGLPLDNVIFVKGWFDQTIPVASVEHIALLHIDADWYESIILVLDQLYDRVIPGGYVVFDDYNYWKGCNRAVHDFLDRRGIPRTVLHRVGGMGVYFQKPM